MSALCSQGSNALGVATSSLVSPLPNPPGGARVRGGTQECEPGVYQNTVGPASLGERRVGNFQLNKETMFQFRLYWTFKT